MFGGSRVREHHREGMENLSALELLPVWVNPEHLVLTARVVMAGHKMKVLCVLDGQELVGVVSAEGLAGADDHDQVCSVMRAPDLVLDFETSVRSAALKLSESDADYAVVVGETGFCGVLTPRMLLGELSRSWDPLTGLSWSDRLREWGMERLKRGNEVTILFIDLDDFGQYNKRFGHILGDRILRNVANALKDCVDNEQDVLVRFGGDEFAIGTVRSRVEAEALAEELEECVFKMFSNDQADHPVGISIGIRGGRRTKERENIHFSATLDDLINLASKDSTRRKQEKRAQQEQDAQAAQAEQVQEHQGHQNGAPPQPQPQRPTFQVVGVYADERASSGLTTVILSHGSEVVSGVHMRTGETALESVAAATAKAVERIYENRPVFVDEVILTQEGERRFVTVNGRAQTDSELVPTSAVKPVEDDLFKAAAQATIEALSPSQ
jgi:IMP dehydrogenase